MVLITVVSLLEGDEFGGVRDVVPGHVAEDAVLDVAAKETFL